MKDLETTSLSLILECSGKVELTDCIFLGHLPSVYPVNIVLISSTLTV